MFLVLFLYIAAFFSLILGEFGQFPFGKSDFSIALIDILLFLNLCAILVWNVGIKRNLKLPRNFPFLIFFWTIGILSLLFSLDLSGWFYLLRFVIYSSLFYVTYHLVKARILGLGEFLTLVKYISLTLAVIGLIQIIIFPDLEVLSAIGYDPHKYRVFGTFLDPNFLGAFLSFGFALSILELTLKKVLKIKDFLNENKWLIVSTFILGLTILLTFSRSAYLMSVAAIIIILAVKNIKLLGVFLVGLLILYFIFPPFNERIQGAINIDKSANERFSSWDRGLIIFQENPILGVGFNNIRNYSQQRNLTKIYSVDGGNAGAGVDSSLIFVMATTGLVGFLVFVLFIFKLFVDMVINLTEKMAAFYNLQFSPIKFIKRVLEVPVIGKWYRTNGPAAQIKSNYLSLPLFALTIGLLINSIFINSLFYPQVMFIWYSMLGVYYGLGEGEGS